MYSQDNLLYILTMLEAIEKVFIYSGEFEGAEELFQANDQLNYNACNNLLLAISEESKKIEDQLKNEFDTIAWTHIAQFRNRLAHDYRGIDREVVYHIIQGYLPDIKEVLVQMIDQLPTGAQLILQQALFSGFYKHLGYLKTDTDRSK